MKLAVVLFLTCLSLVFCDESITVEDNVLVLTTKNFDKAIEDNQHILVEFCEYFSVFCAFIFVIVDRCRAWCQCTRNILLVHLVDGYVAFCFAESLYNLAYV